MRIREHTGGHSPATTPPSPPPSVFQHLCEFGLLKIFYLTKLIVGAGAGQASGPRVNFELQLE